MRNVDLDNWSRKEQYHFFKNYEQPFFNLTAQVDISGIYKLSKETNTSLHLLYQFYMLKAANEIDEIKIRLYNEKPVIFDNICSGTTISRPSGSFGFCYFEFHTERDAFITLAETTIEQFNDNNKLETKDGELNMLYCTTIPWVSFTSLQHPIMGGKTAGIPSIAFGKYYKQGDKVLMPVSVQLHHALADGYHAGLLFSKFEAYCADTSLA